MFQKEEERRHYKILLTTYRMNSESKDGEEDIYKNVDIENINVNITSMKEIIDESVDNNTNKISNHRSSNNESDEDSDIKVKQ